MNNLTQKRLKELLSYDEETGFFTWKITNSPKAVAGSIAGTIHSKKYTNIGIDGKCYQAHRLVWLCLYGKYPKHDIDHINHDCLDNRIANLRDITHIENCRHSRISKNNTSGYKGVYLYKPYDGYSRWRACLHLNGKAKLLGYFKDVKDAARAYNKAAKKYYGEFAYLNKI